MLSGERRIGRAPNSFFFVATPRAASAPRKSIDRSAKIGPKDATFGPERCDMSGLSATVSRFSGLGQRWERRQGTFDI